MKEIEVYLHGVRDKVELIRVPEDSSVTDILTIAKNAGLIGDTPDDTMDLFIGDSEDPANKEQRLHHLGVKERAHLICHHCKKIEVYVSYNGGIKTEHFPPTAKVGTVLKWALRAFGLSGNDAAHMVLRIESTQNDLANDVRIGSLVLYSHCSLKLYLTPRVRVEG